MKKNRIVPLSTIALAAMLIGFPVVDAKTFTENEIKEFAKVEIAGEVNYDSVYIVGRHMFKNKIAVNDIMTGSRTLEDNEKNVIYLRDNEGNWSNAVTGEAITPTSEFEIQVADYKSVEDAELKAKLDKLKKDVEAKNEEEYTETSWNKITEALAMSEKTDDTRKAKFDALTTAYNNLVFENLETLEALKTKYSSKVASDYTAESFTAFTTSLEKVSKMSEETYAEIANKITAYSTIEAFLTPNAGNNTALKTELQKHLEMNGENFTTFKNVETDYTTESWTSYVEVVESAKAVYENTNSLQSEIDNAKNSLAAVKLTFKDLERLNTLISNAKSLKETDFTTTTYSVLTTALEAVGEDYVPTSNTDILSKITAIETAIDGLIEKTVDAAYKEAVKLATEKIAMTNEYDSDSIDALTEAKNTTPEATNDGYKEATENINAKISELVFKDQAGLDAILETIKGLKESDYTASSWKIYTAASKDVINTIPESNAEVLQITGVLTEAVEKLQVEEITTDDLQATIDAEYQTDEEGNVTTELIISNEEDDGSNKYTPETWTAYTDAIAAAKNLVANHENKKQSDLTKAAEAINTTREALVLKNVSVLQTAIDSQYKVDEEGNVTTELDLVADNYTKESFKAYTDAIAAAKEALTTSNAEMLEAKEALLEAENNLVNREVPVLTELINAEYQKDEEGNVTTDLVLSNEEVEGVKPFTDASWTAYTNAINAAKAALTGTNEEMIAAAATLKDAKAKLVSTDAKTALEAAKSKANTYAANEYMNEQYNKLTEALAMEEVTTSEIEAKTAAILAAIDALIPTNKTTLTNLVEGIKLTEAHYTEASWASLQTALAKPEKTYAEVATKITAINNAKDALVFANKAEVDSLIANTGLTSSNYTKESWDKLQDVITLVKNGDLSSYDSIAKGINDIKAAKKALVPSNKVTLENLQKTVDALKEAEYTTESWTEFKTAYDKVVFPDGTYALNETRINGINAAMDKLVVKNAEELATLETELAALVENNYTPESWTAYTTAKNKVEATDNTFNGNAKRISALNEAKALLVAKEA